MTRPANHSLLQRETFDRLVRCAVAGDRCPTASEGMDGRYVKELAHAERLCWLLVIIVSVAALFCDAQDWLIAKYIACSAIIIFAALPSVFRKKS